LVLNKNIPDGWNVFQYGKVLTVRNERKVNDGEYPLFSLTIADGVSPKSSRYNREFLVRDKGSKTYKVIQPNDLVFNPSNLRWGAMARSKVDFPVLVSPIYEILYPANKQIIDSVFLEYLAKSEHMMKQYVRYAEGTLVERTALKLPVFLKLLITVPPFLEQQKISSILASVDDVIEKTEAKINKLKDLKKAMMQELSTKGIGHTEFKDSPVGMIPRSWEVKSLEDISIAPICYGIVQIGSHYPNGIPVLAIRDLNGDYLSNINRVFPEIESGYSRSRIFHKDVLISVKGTIGRIGIVPKHFSGNISRDIARLRVKPNILPEIIKYILESPIGQEILNRISVGTTRAELSIVRLKKVQIPIPPMKESVKISKIIYSLNKVIDWQYKRHLHTKSLKKALMQDLLTGKVRVKV
jgi:type I restriction enzyme, S subunit